MNCFFVLIGVSFALTFICAEGEVFAPEFIQCDDILIESPSQIDDSIEYFTFSYNGKTDWLQNAIIQFCENINAFDSVSCGEGMRSVVSCFQIYPDENILQDPKLQPSTVSRGVIVEPRNHPALAAVVNNVCTTLGIPITIFCSNANLGVVTELMAAVPCVDVLVRLEHEDLRVADPSSGAGLPSFDYNTLLLSDKMFWSRIGATDSESVLIFQTDSGICGGANNSQLLEYFSRHHYCGALIEDVEGGELHVGAGGLSVRHIGMMRRLLDVNRDHQSHMHWEDILFSLWCKKDMYCSMCPVRIAHQFSIGSPRLSADTIVQQWVDKYELLVDEKSPLPWSFHKNWDGSQFYSVCPINSLVRSLNM